MGDMVVINTILCGDVLEQMATIPDQSIDLVVTSPPYNLLNSKGSGFKGKPRGFWAKSQMRNGYDEHDDNMPHDQYVSWQREVLTELMRVIPDTGAIFYNHKWRVQSGLIQDRSDIVSGFPVRQIIIWQRQGGINFNRGYFLPTYEVIYMIAKAKFRLKQTAVGQGDVWKIPQDRGIDHPCPFPVELPIKIIESTDAKIVLDPFMGSGTTAIAAIKCGINYIGIEKSSKYIELAEKRIQSAKLDNVLY
jgi:modification methylase